MTRVKKRSAAPVIIAPITLVAANSIAKRITDVKIVPRIPTISTGRLAHTHSDFFGNGDFKNAIAR